MDRYGRSLAIALLIVLILAIGFVAGMVAASQPSSQPSPMRSIVVYDEPATTSGHIVIEGALP